MDINIPKLYGEYGEYINKSRQFPLSTDGLKPVERRVLLSSYILAKNKFVKSARVDGHVLGNFHPHGSSYGTIVQLVRQGFLEGQGNFGMNSGTDPCSAAAMRYTEIKLFNKVIKMAFENINYVEWKVNSLGEKEPQYLPTMLPFCLMGREYTQGIGFGYRTFIPCYKPEDLIKRLMWLISEKQPEDEPIIKPITDCKILSNNNDLKDLLTKGKAKLDIEGVISLSPRNHSITLKSWPPGRRFETFLTKFSKELDNQDISWIDLSSQQTNVLFEVAKQRNKDLIFKEFASKLKESIKGSISFEIRIVNLNGQVELKSVDDLLIETFRMFISLNKKVLIDQIGKFQESIDELKLLEKVRPFLSNILKPQMNMEQSLNIISHLSKINKEDIKSLFAKYKINKLLTLDSDTTKLLGEQKVHKDNLSNLHEFVVKQYTTL